MHRITLIPGDGVGPEIAEATVRVIEATGVPIQWDLQEAGEDVCQSEGTPLPERVIESIRKNRVAIKGPVTTPVGKGYIETDPRPLCMSETLQGFQGCTD